MEKRLENTTSLKTRILIPLFIVCGVLFALLIFFDRGQAERQMIDNVDRHARLVANSLVYATDTVSTKGALHRYVSAISAQNEIDSIFIAGGDPLEILACSENKYMGRSVVDIDDSDVSDELQSSLANKSSRFHIIQPEKIAVYSEPISLGHLAPGDGLGTRGTIVIVFNLQHFQTELNAQFLQSITWKGVVLILTILIAYALVVSRVYQPIRSIIRGVNGIDDGKFMSVSGSLVNDEIGYLARILEESFLKESDSGRQAKFFAKNLKFQKDALDSHGIVSEANAKGKITYANELFCKISGYDREELLQQDHRILKSGYHPKSFFTSMYDSLAKNGVWKGEICNRAKDGSNYWVDSTIVAFRKENNEIERYVSIRTDITYRKEAELELVRANKKVEVSLKSENAARLEAEKANLAKSQFLATMSHEIRTPMNGMIGVLHLLEQGLPASKRKLLKTAKNSADDLLVLINDILDFSKIEAGKMTIEHVSFDALELVEDVCDIHAAPASEKGVELIVRSQPRASHFAVGDPHRLRQIVSNLVSNAIKFTEKGEVTVFLNFQNSASGDTCLRVEVVDSGIGVSEEAMDALFETFSQANSSTTRKFGGTGLGLAICKKLVELMGGEIGVESTPGEGATFWFQVPQGAVQIRDEAVTEKYDASGKSVLLVSSNASIRSHLSDWLTFWGCRVFEVNTFQELDIPLLVEGGGQSNRIDFAIIEEMVEGVNWAEEYQDLVSTCDLSVGEILVLRNSGGLPVEDRAKRISSLIKPVRVASLLDRIKDSSEECETVEVGVDVESFDWLRVLVVDDNSVNRMVAGSLIKQRHGIDADLAENGVDAIDQLKKGEYDIVFMDCMMPVMDGYDATRKIREGAAGEAHRTIPIVALTANAMSGDNDLCKECGMSDYITKPIEPSDVQSIFKKWSGRRHQSFDGLLSRSDNVEDPISRTLNLNKLNDIYQGDVAAMRKILKLFFVEADDILNQLRNEVFTNRDLEKTRFFAHRLKGSSGEFGAMLLQKCLAEIERLCIHETIESVEKKIPEAIDALGDFRAKIEESDLLQFVYEN